MSSARTEPTGPTFFDLYSRGDALPDDIDDFVEKWHEGADVRAREVPLHTYLGLNLNEYELWLKDPEVLPLVLIARREKRPVREVMSDHIDELPMAARSSDVGMVKALRAWVAGRRKG